MHLDPIQRKSLGAFYTDNTVVEFLVAWGLRAPRERVLDPSCGDGRFLVAAARAGVTDLIGCDLDPGALDLARKRLNGIRARIRWIEGDFFLLDPSELGPVDLVVGNPPYVRYQRFRGEARHRALESAASLGVRLTGLTSSWAPFLLHATRFLKKGGDLAMVVPAEIVHSQYGSAALEGLTRQFGRIRLLGFDQNLFPDVQEETFLLLAENRGMSTNQVEWVDVGHPNKLGTFLQQNPQGVPVAVDETVCIGKAIIGPEAREVWTRWTAHPSVWRLGDIGQVINGYVSGDNRFFHRTLNEAKRMGLPLEWLIPAARSAKSIEGLFFSASDVNALERRGVPHHLVVPPDGLFADPHSDALARWIELGQRSGVPNRYKCRTRHPWWRVPGIRSPTLLWSYMIGDIPRVSVNTARAVFSNSLHGIFLLKEVDPLLIAVSVYTSLGLLSVEMEGRVYGGGVLKLEPTECAAVRLPLPRMAPETLHQIAYKMDRWLRAKRFDAAITLADETILIQGLNMDRSEVALLRRAWQRLLQRRKHRKRAARAVPNKEMGKDGVSV